MGKGLFRIALSCVIGACALTTLNAQVPATPLTVTYTYSGDPLLIPVDSVDVAVLMRISVPRSLTITKVTASAQVNYPAVGDLNVYMFSPNGTRVKILERNCGSLVNIDSSFDDAAQSKYADFCPAEAGKGPFRGNEPLSNYNGQNSLGVWTLAVENNGSNSRYGAVVGFSVTITGTAQTRAAIAPEGIRNTGNLLEKGLPIAPGEGISVLGCNLGPQVPVNSGDTTWPTWIDGTVVRINGQDAPMKFISFYMIEVQVPMELDLSRNAKVSVFRNGVTTNEVEVPVASTSPAVLTTNLSGYGQAAAVNSDGKQNGSANPAAKGSVITVYAGGLGVTDPQIGVGQPAPLTPALKTVAPVTATIGGVVAQVRQAALAPDKVSVYAVEIVVPAGVRTGAAEVLLTAGDRTSQRGATVQVQ
jgi:uncharacterized protein (TIGR03437 family)